QIRHLQFHCNKKSEHCCSLPNELFTIDSIASLFWLSNHEQHLPTDQTKIKIVKNQPETNLIRLPAMAVNDSAVVKTD
ncbi:hypothetical protein NE652_09930, partial [Bifidobacterium pseudocatenulatum]|nr:hypothetical protein [Bifidobacterium pseudocatenulatum]